MLTATIQRLLADPANPLCQQRWRYRTCGPNTRILIASNKGENAEGPSKIAHGASWQPLTVSRNPREARPLIEH